jgi:pilus assembly protein CpaE
MDDPHFEFSDEHIQIPEFHAESESEETSDVVESPPVAETEETSSKPSLCVAFRGVSGGVGVTSLAISTAHIFAQAKRGEVCLVDMDFDLGMCAHYLDLGMSPSISDFQTDPVRVDKNYVRAMLGHHEAGFAVLGSPGAMGGNEQVNPQTVLQVLDVLADMFSVIIMDVPRLTRPWTEAALLAADRVCLVTELNIPALHVTRKRLDDFSAMGVEKTDVILSKYERRSFRASLRQADAERAIGQDVTAMIVSDAHVASEAMNCGVPATQAGGDSRLSKDISALARTLSPHFADRRRRKR